MEGSANVLPSSLHACKELSGDNCEVSIAPAVASNDGVAVDFGIGVAVGLIALFVSVLITYKVREHRIKMKPKDFMKRRVHAHRLKSYWRSAQRRVFLVLWSKKEAKLSRREKI